MALPVGTSGGSVSNSENGGKNGYYNSISVNVPIWARAIAAVGIPGAIAILLVWIGANTVPTIQRTTETNHTEILALKEMVREQKEQIAALHRMVQRVCSSVAKNDDERQRCFDK